MNILMFSRLYSPHVGGVERHIENISKLLIGKGHNIVLVTEKYDDDLGIEEIINGVRVFRLSYPNKKYFGILFVWLKLALKYWNKMKVADIVHIHDVFIWFLPFRFLLLKKPVYVTFHGYESYPVKKIAFVQRKITEVLTNGNICVGKFMTKWYRTKPTIIFYGGVDSKKYYPYFSNKYKYDAIFSSRLDKQTGVSIYLEVIKQLRKRIPHFNSVILGDGEYRREAEKLAITKGFVTDPSIYFRQSRIAFVSRYLAILEAFASKKLVFAVYDNPLKKDYLTMTPFRNWIIIESDPKVLTLKIIDYFNNPKKYKKMIDDAYQWVQGQTWERVVEEYLRLWKY